MKCITTMAPQLRAVLSSFGALIAAFGSFLAPAQAEGIQAESFLPYAGAGADFAWAGTKDVNHYDLLIRGGYSTGLVGFEALVPLGWYKPEFGDTEFAVGNIGAVGRAGTGLNLGAIHLELAGAMSVYLPTASKGANSGLMGIRHLRPGLRERDAVPIELGVSATAGVAAFEITGTFGTTIVIPTDGDTRTFTWLQGGIALGYWILPMFQIVAEYTMAARTAGGDTAATHQVSAGLMVDVPLVQLGVNARIPVGGEQLSDAPVVLGVDARFAF